MQKDNGAAHLRINQKTSPANKSRWLLGLPVGHPRENSATSTCQAAKAAARGDRVHHADASRTMNDIAEPGWAGRRSIRVLHVIDQLSGGGAEASLQQILLGTAGPTLTHAVAVLKPPADSLDRLTNTGIVVFAPERPLRSRIAGLRHVLKAIRSFGPDLVHTTLTEASLAGRVAAKLVRLPVLTSLVQPPYAPEVRRTNAVAAWKVGVVQAIDILLSRYATTRFHAVSELVATVAAANLRIDRGRIRVVPRGRDLERIGQPSPERRRAVRAALGVDADTPVVLNVGREEPAKGHVHLLHAFRLVRNQLPNAALVIAGPQGNSTPSIDTAVRELRLDSAVHRLGFRDDVAELLTTADAFVCSSLYEGAAGAVLEAMAMRLPVVAHDIPAMREILEEGRCGTLVPVADSDSLAAAICTVLRDRHAAAARAEVARMSFEQHYNLQACLNGMRRLYEDLARR